MADRQSQAEAKLMRLVNDPKLAALLGSTMAEVAVELADAKAEARHWKASFEAVALEIKILAAVIIASGKLPRIVITRADQERIPASKELHVGTPEPGVRIYELRERGVLEAEQNRVVLQ